ncbi:unnamed protein product, partial [marine sediment metagenome]
MTNIGERKTAIEALGNYVDESLTTLEANEGFYSVEYKIINAGSEIVDKRELYTYTYSVGSDYDLQIIEAQHDLNTPNTSVQLLDESGSLISEANPLGVVGSFELTGGEIDIGSVYVTDGTIDVASLPEVLGSVEVTGGVLDDVTVTSIPAVTGSVEVYGDGLTGSVEVSNPFDGNVLGSVEVTGGTIDDMTGSVEVSNPFDGEVSGEVDIGFDGETVGSDNPLPITGNLTTDPQRYSPKFYNSTTNIAVNASADESLASIVADGQIDMISCKFSSRNGQFVLNIDG